VLNRVSKCFLIMVIAVGMTVTSLPAQSQDQNHGQAGETAQGQSAQGQAGQPARNWKDRAEYDLYNASVKEQDPNKRLALLNSWKEKYQISDYAPERLQIYLTTCSALNQPDKVIATDNEVLQTDAKNLTALYLITLNVQRLPKAESRRPRLRRGG